MPSTHPNLISPAQETAPTSPQHHPLGQDLPNSPERKVRFQTCPDIIPPKKNIAYYLELLGEEGTILRKLEIAASVCRICGPQEPSVKRTLQEAEHFRLSCLARSNIYPVQQGSPAAPRTWNSTHRGVELVRRQAVEHLFEYLEYVDDVAFV